MCELSLDKMGAVFEDSNAYMLHMMYQAMGVCLHMGEWDQAIGYGEKVLKQYKYESMPTLLDLHRTSM